MKYAKKLLIIDDIGEMSETYQQVFQDDAVIEVVTSSSDFEELKSKLRYDFFIINVHCDGLKQDLRELVAFVRRFLDYVKPYMMAITSERKRIAALEIPGLSLMPKPVNREYLADQTRNTIHMLAANRSIDDITHLPGNYVIDTALKRKIAQQEKFVLVYLDIDKFKPFTDYYGVYKAGRLIKYLADVLTETVVTFGRKSDFVGHVGGDDYVLILNDYGYAEQIGSEIIHRFEEGVRQFYAPEDLDRGYIEILDRKGRLNRFGIISVSIAMVSNEHMTFQTTDEVYRRMMEVKEAAKQISGSVMLSDTSKIDN